MKTLEILKKLGEDLSTQYEIVWENWLSDEGVQLEKYVLETIEIYEEEFENWAFGEKDPIEEMNILEDVVSAYVLFSIIQRKRKIEEVITSSINI